MIWLNDVPSTNFNPEGQVRFDSFSSSDSWLGASFSGPSVLAKNISPEGIYKSIPLRGLLSLALYIS